MEEKRDKYTNIILGITILVAYTLLAVTSPNFMFFDRDEIHAINIAKNFNFFEILDIMRAEGHTFLWYMIIKPFVSIKALSPWIIKVINFLFMLTSVALLWFKAPFKTITKVLVIFSFPILFLYPTFARCYGIGILLLFILTMLYEKKLKHPILYPLLIFLTANTSLMACAGAGAFGILYFVELFKEKNIKNILIALGFCLLTIFILIYQWHDPIIPEYSYQYSIVSNFHNTIPILHIIPTILLKKACLIGIFAISIIISFFYLKNHIASLAFITFTTICLVYCFLFLYAGFFYHHYFFYIYLIIAFWLSYKNIPDHYSSKKIFIIFFCVLSLILVTRSATFKLQYQYQINNYDHYLNKLVETIPLNSTVYTQVSYFNTNFIYFSDLYNLKNLDGGKLITKENYMKIYSKGKPVELKKTINIAEPNSYMIISSYGLKSAIDFKEFRKTHKPLCYNILGYYIYKIKD